MRNESFVFLNVSHDFKWTQLSLVRVIVLLFTFSTRHTHYLQLDNSYFAFNLLVLQGNGVTFRCPLAVEYVDILLLASLWCHFPHWRPT